MKALVENLFRREHGRVVASLTRALGPAHLDLAEEAIMEATLRALRTWPFDGIPDRPSAWLYRVARNYALDQIRRGERWQSIETRLRMAAEGSDASAPPRSDHSLTQPPATHPDGALTAQLLLVFACCHPRLPRTSRVALTLKLVSGCSTREISQAFFVSEATLRQRIVRARTAITSGEIPFEIPEHAPSGQDWSERLDSVLDVLYLLFNEGYAAHSAGPSIRSEWIREAIDLAELLTRHSWGDQPRVWALRALCLLQSSRLNSRIDEAGAMVPLAEQDRAKWDTGAISEGMLCLAQAGTGTQLSEFHLLAGIAACHANAPTYQETDWSRILEYYDLLLATNPSGLLQLNRAVAVSMVDGPQAALDQLVLIEEELAAIDRARLAATRGHLWAELAETALARNAYEEAQRLTKNEAEKRYYQRRQAELCRA